MGYIMYMNDEYEKVMSEISRIAAEPIDDTPYNIVANPKPVVESVVDFNGIKVDTGSWSEGNGVGTSAKKVGAAKTAPTKKVAPVVKQVTTAETKSSGKVTQVKAEAPVKTDKAPKAGASTGSFDNVAKSAQSSQKGGADKNKKFFDGLTEQKKAELFRGYVKSLAIDKSSAKDAEKILAKFDEISKFAKKKAAKLESVKRPSNARQDNEQAYDYAVMLDEFCRDAGVELTQLPNRIYSFVAKGSQGERYITCSHRGVVVYMSADDQMQGKGGMSIIIDQLPTYIRKMIA